MKNRFLKVFVLPLIIASVLSALWAAAVLNLWKFFGRSAEMLVDGTPAARVSARLARVEDAVAPMIWYSIIALMVPLTIWFLTCLLTPVGTGQARRLRLRWMALFVLSILIAVGLSWWRGFSQGNLASYVSSSALLIQGVIGFILLLLGYWIISAVSTNAVYRPATLPG